MKKMLSLLMLVALVSAVPAFAAEAGDQKPNTPVVNAPAEGDQKPNEVKEGEKKENTDVKNEGDKDNTDKNENKGGDKGDKEPKADEAGVWSKVCDLCYNPVAQAVVITSALTGASAFATNYYNKNYVEKKKKRMNPGIVAAVVGVLTATTAGTYIYWDNIHAYVFAGQKATEAATATGDAASKKLKDDADAAQKALNAKVAPKAPEAPKVPETTVVVPNAEQKPEADAQK